MYGPLIPVLRFLHAILNHMKRLGLPYHTVGFWSLYHKIGLRSLIMISNKVKVGFTYHVWIYSEVGFTYHTESQSIEFTYHAHHTAQVGFTLVNAIGVVHYN